MSITGPKFEQEYQDPNIELQEKQAQAIAEIREKEAKNGVEDKTIKVGFIERVGKVYEEALTGAKEIFEEPTKDLVDKHKKNGQVAAKAIISAGISLIPIAGASTSATSIAAKGADDAMETGAKVAAKNADEAKGVLGELAISKEAKKKLKDAAKKLDPTPDVPVWISAVAGAASLANIPFADLAPEVIQLLIIAGKNQIDLAKWGIKVGQNARDYIERRVNTVANKATLTSSMVAA